MLLQKKKKIKLNIINLVRYIVSNITIIIIIIIINFSIAPPLLNLQRKIFFTIISPIDFSRRSRSHARWWTIMNDIVAEAMEQGISKQRSNRRCHVRSVIRIALHLTPRNANNCRSTANKRLTQWGNHCPRPNISRRVCTTGHFVYDRVN